MKVIEIMNIVFKCECKKNYRNEILWKNRSETEDTVKKSN